jgi:uncharacterized membrane protein YphA (DoxX/SURF4 family)
MSGHNKRHLKNFFSGTIIVLLARILLGGLFIGASLDKFTDTAAFTTSILNYKVVGQEISLLIATILPSLELLCGLCLILGIYPRSSAVIVTGLLFIFTVIVGSALIRGLDISCGCFSQDPYDGKIGIIKILENLGMMVPAIFLSVAKDYGFTLPGLEFRRMKKSR